MFEFTEVAVSGTVPNENINDAVGIVAVKITPFKCVPAAVVTDEVDATVKLENPANVEPLANEPDGIKKDDALTKAAVSIFLV